MLQPCPGYGWFYIGEYGTPPPTLSEQMSQLPGGGRKKFKGGRSQDETKICISQINGNLFRNMENYHQFRNKY
jgi:hypothetical protein